MTNTILVERDSCWACPVQCKRVVETHGRYETLREYGGPEYETVGSFGSLLGNDDLEGVAYANQLCNAYGLDTISAGVTIAWAMECFERGLLTTKDTGGLELKFGNIQAAIELVEQMAHRTGFGDVLAEGSLRAARKIGRDTEKYTMQIKGQEIPMHEPRLKVALDIGYATSPTGADHCHNVHDTFYNTEGNNALDMRSVGILHPPAANVLDAEKLRLAVYATNKRLLGNSMGYCHFMAYHYQQLADLVNGVTGWNVSVHELMLVVERSMALARAVNYREGLTAKDDVNHWRFATPFTSGPVPATIIPPADKKKAMDLYYDYRGWDKKTGAPTASHLHQLGLHWLAEELYK
jgi:aldehyde:ferredoxin oxidoreductase